MEEAIRAVQNAGQSPEGYIVAWMLPARTRRGQDRTELFDVAFAPEKPRPSRMASGDRAARRQAGPGGTDKIFGGNERAAYLRTQLPPNKDQDVS